MSDFEENSLQLLDILGCSSNNLSFSSFNKILIFSSGSYIVYYNLKTDTKTFIQYHQDEICLVKFIDESQHYMVSIDKNSSPLLTLWDIPSFNCLFSINIKTRPSFHVNSIYLEQIKKDNFIILITSIDCNLIYELTIQNEICNIEFINHISNIQNMIYSFKIFYNSNDMVIMLKDAIQFYTINTIQKKITLKYNINFPFVLVKNSLRVSPIVNIIAFITEKGHCLLYDQNGNSKPSIIPFDQDNFTSCEFSGDSLCCGTSNGTIYCYNIYEYKMKFYIDRNSLIESKEKHLLNKKDRSNVNDMTFSHSIEQIFIDENVDTILIKSSDNSLLLSPVTSLIKDTRGQFNFVSVGNEVSLYSFSNSANIINIELKPREDNNYENVFYTCSYDQTIMKYTIDFNDSKLSNQYFDIEKINKKLIKNQNNLSNSNNKIYISTIKFHPLYKYKLFAGDNKGAIYLFDTNDNIFQYKKYIVGTFEIVNLSFNSSGSLISIGFETGMNVICDLNKECEYMIRVSEHFLTPNEIEERKINNQKMSFSYFFKNLNTEVADDIILYNKSNNEIEISKLLLDTNNNYNNVLNKEIISTLKIPNNIIDIDVHISENYTICLTDVKQIVVNQINNGEVTAIIDLNNQLDKIYNFTIDNNGLYLGLICDIRGINSNRSNLIIFEIGTGRVQTYINNAFPMSKCKFDYGGKYLVIGGIKGDFSVWKLNQEMNLAIVNVNNEMQKNKNFWEQYEIKYTNDNNNDFENIDNGNNNNIIREKFDNFNPNNDKFMNREIQADNFGRNENLNKSLNLEDEFKNLEKNNMKFNEDPNIDNNLINERMDSDENNNNKKVENVFENNLQNSYQKFIEDKNFKNSDSKFQNNFSTRINRNEPEKQSSEKNLINLLNEKPKNKNFFPKLNYKEDNLDFNNNIIPKEKLQPKTNFTYSNINNNLDPSLYPSNNKKKKKSSYPKTFIPNKGQPIKKLNYVKLPQKTQNRNYPNINQKLIIDNSLKEQNEMRIKNIAYAINEMLSPEKKYNDEEESIDQLDEDINYNNIIKSHNPMRENNENKNLKGYFAMDESREYFINNREGGTIDKENKNIYPEPDDIDDNLVPEKKNDDNIKKYDEIMNENNVNNDNSLNHISENQNPNFDMNLPTNKNLNSTANDIDYLEQNIRDFEKRNNFK